MDNISKVFGRKTETMSLNTPHSRAELQGQGIILCGFITWIYYQGLDTVGPVSIASSFAQWQLPFESFSLWAQKAFSSQSTIVKEKSVRLLTGHD